MSSTNSYSQSTTDNEIYFNTTDSTNSTDYDYDFDIEIDSTDLVEWTVKAVATLLGALLVLVLYKNLSEKRNNKVYDSLNLKHIIFSALHALLIELPAYNGKTDCNSLSAELLCVLELSAPMWTACVSLKMFTDLYLLMGRRDVYSAKDFTIFGFTSIVILNAYELFFIMVGRSVSEEQNFPSAVRLTSVLLTMSLPVAVACVLTKSLCFKSSAINKPIGLFLLLHLLVFILCDVCLALFIIAKTTVQPESVVHVAANVLQYRLVLEIGWYVGSHYLGKVLRIYEYTEN